MPIKIPEMGMCLSSCPLRFEQLGRMWILEKSWFGILTERGAFAFWYKTLQEMMHFLAARWQRRATEDSASSHAVGAGPLHCGWQEDLPSPSHGISSSSSSQAKEVPGWLTGQTALGYWDSLQSQCCHFYQLLLGIWLVGKFLTE